MKCRKSWPKLVLWTSVLLWMALIFTLSSQTAKDSSELSGYMIRKVAEFLRPDFPSLVPAKQAQFIAGLQHIARKTAHALLYMILGALCMKAFLFWHKKRYAAVLSAALVCIAYAATDEVHQLFVHGRSGELGDVVIDFGGSLVGIFLVVLVNSVVGDSIQSSKNKT